MLNEMEKINGADLIGSRDLWRFSGVGFIFWKEELLLILLGNLVFSSLTSIPPLNAMSTGKVSANGKMVLLMLS